jgi:hypothetical protein
MISRSDNENQELTMSEMVCERYYRDRLQSLGRLASLWETELSPQDQGDVVAACLELSNAGRHLIEGASQRLFKNGNLTVAWLKERRRIIEELSDRYLELADSIRTSALRAWQSAGVPPRKDVISVLDTAIKVVAEAKRTVLEDWLVGDPQEMAEARAAIARGESLDADAAFAEIAGTDVERWRRSIEDYKRNQSRSIAE